MKKITGFFKGFWKELSVFALVIVVFLGLWGYRTATYKSYKTINEKKLTSWVKKDKDFFLVVGDSTDSTTASFEETMTKYCTKNRGTNLYFIDSSTDEDFDSYLEKTLDVSVQEPSLLYIKDGKVADKKEDDLSYYTIVDFVDTNK